MATVRTPAERTSFTLIATTAAMLRALRRLAAWPGLTAWHERRRSVGHLRSLTDAQLRDIGVSRTDIASLVHGTVAPARRGG